MSTVRGRMWFAELGLTLKMKMDEAKKCGGKGTGGFEVNLNDDGGLMQMIDGFTLLRLTAMMAMMNVSFTKEELLALNKQLNSIPKPKSKK